MNRIIFDIDTQKDFLSPLGKCYVGDEKLLCVTESIISNIEEILVNGIRNGIPVISSVFANNCQGFCDITTEGQEKIKETCLVDSEFYYNIAHTHHGIDMTVAKHCWQMEFEKEGADIWDVNLGQPDNLHTYLRTNNINIVTVIGNNFNDSVLLTILGLTKSKYHVEFIPDAIVNFSQNSCVKALCLGAEYIHMEEFIEKINNYDCD